MKLIALTVKNFRCYQHETILKIDDLTTIIGKNDIGKSSILEALEIFFNNTTVKIEQGDANIYSGSSDVEITCRSCSSVPDFAVPLPSVSALRLTTLRLANTSGCPRRIGDFHPLEICTPVVAPKNLFVYLYFFNSLPHVMWQLRKT